MQVDKVLFTVWSSVKEVMCVYYRLSRTQSFDHTNIECNDGQSLLFYIIYRPLI